MREIHVEAAFGRSSMALTAAEFESFAEEDDPIPFHVDEAVAARSQFDGITARCSTPP